MLYKDFVRLKQWLTDAGCVVFHLEHALLGRQGDNQFEFLNANLEGDTGVFNFSSDLKIEMRNPSMCQLSKLSVELQSIEYLLISWGKTIGTLHGTSVLVSM